MPQFDVHRNSGRHRELIVAALDELFSRTWK
jgi:hypothetical protein